MAESLVAVVSLRGVIKSFNVSLPNETEVLHGVNLDLSRGEFQAVMGPSGSGKSTLLNIVGLLDRPTHGTLAINGTETTMLPFGASLPTTSGYEIWRTFPAPMSKPTAFKSAAVLV